MRTARFAKAVACGVFAGGILWLSCVTFVELLDHLEIALGSRERVPHLTKLVDAWVPEQTWLLWTGITLFVSGYSWLAWLDEPSPLVCALHGFAFVVFFTTMSAVFPWAHVIQGIGEYDGPARPWFNTVRDAPWFVICSLPLALAALTSRLRRAPQGGRIH